MSAFDPFYDRAAASALLAELAAPGLLRAADPAPLPSGTSIGYTTTEMTWEAGSSLTLSQRLYLERFMPPCRPDQVVSATHRLVWTDSQGIVCTGHFGPSELGARTPIAVRETVLSLWRRLAADERFASACDALTDEQLDVLAATTTDAEPLEIFRIGVEAVGRALVQHALIAHQAGYRDAAEFADAMRRSGIFGAVASTWYWELQASTQRRGMIPVQLHRTADGMLRYRPDTLALLAAMKQRTIAEAHATMRRATAEEGLSPAAAVAKYHTELDAISRQYALLDQDVQPRCLAVMSNTVQGKRFSVLPVVVDVFVETFVQLLDRIEPVQAPPTEAAARQDPADGHGSFSVPDMNCKHCRMTITAVLESHGAEAIDVDLVTKRVQARFDGSAQRAASFEAIRDSGYTVIAHESTG
jgi:copper chaperone CopZ